MWPSRTWAQTSGGGIASRNAASPGDAWLGGSTDDNDNNDDDGPPPPPAAAAAARARMVAPADPRAWRAARGGEESGDFAEAGDGGKNGLGDDHIRPLLEALSASEGKGGGNQGREAAIRGGRWRSGEGGGDPGREVTHPCARSERVIDP